MTKIKNESASTLLLALIFMLGLVAFAMAYLSLVSYDTRNIGGQENNIKAFYLAEAGLNKVIWYLMNTAPDGSIDGSWRTTAYPAAPGAGGTDPKQESLSDGNFIIWVETSGSNLQITSKGTINGISRIVRQEVTVATSGTIEAFTYALHGDKNVNFQNSEGTITGNISAGNNIQNKDDMTINGVITENSEVVFPTVDYNGYEALAGVNTISGNHTFTAGTYSGVWYVNGHVSVNSDVTFNGTIVSTGKITLENKGENIVFNPTANYPAMIAHGEISGATQTNLVINGLIFSEGNISFSKADETVLLNGSMISDGNISLNNGDGNFMITYDSELASDPPPYFSVSGGSISVSSVLNTWDEI